MLNLAELVRGRGADALRRRVRHDEVGILVLELLQLVEQAVELGVEISGSSRTW